MKPRDFEDFDTPFPKGTRFPDVRERLIGTALKLIADEGSVGFSLNEVLRRSRVSKGSFFHHFRNLDDLCRNCFERCKSFVTPSLTAEDFESVEALLLAFGDETIERTMSKQFFRLTMFFGEKAMSDELYLEIQKEPTELYMEEVSKLVLRLAPHLDHEKVREGVAFLLIVNQGIASHRVMFRDPQRMKRVWPASVKAALSLMGVSESAG